MGAGVAANGVSQMLQMVIRLAEVPVLMGLWGAGGYGEWLLISALPVALSFGDGGFTKSAQREMVQRAGRGDEQGTSAVFQSTWIMLLAISAFCVSLLPLLFVKGEAVANFLNIELSSQQQLSIALTALALKVLLYFQCSLLQAGLTAAGQYPKSVLLQTLAAALNFTGVVAGSFAGFGVAGAAMGSLLGTAVGYTVILIAARSNPKAPRYGLSHASMEEIRMLWRPSMANLAFPGADALNSQGLRLVIGLTLGPVALASFATLRTLCRTALQPVLALARTVEPELSLAYGLGHHDQAKYLFLKTSQLGVWLSLLLSAIVMLVGPPIYHVWVRGKFDLDWRVVSILLAASLVNAVWGIALAIPTSINRHVKASVMFLLVYGFLAACLARLFSIKELGIIGPSISVLVIEVLIAAILLRLTLTITSTSFKEWLLQIMHPPTGLAIKVVRQTCSMFGRKPAVLE